MHIIVFLIIGLSALSLQAQAEDVVTVLEESPTSIEIDTVTNTKAALIKAPKGHATDAAPVVIITDQPVGVSMQEALAAPEDPYVEGKDLNTDDDSESPDEAGEDGEEDGEEDGDDETGDEE